MYNSGFLFSLYDTCGIGAINAYFFNRKLLNMKCLPLQDLLTDLKADAEQLPVEPVREDWLGHKVIYLFLPHHQFRFI